LEIIAPDPNDLGCILSLLVVRWRKFQAGDKHPGLDSRHLVDAMTHRRGDDMPPLLDDMGGGKRRYSSKRRKSRTMKKRK
jgi:hypothetical protein